MLRIFKWILFAILVVASIIWILLTLDILNVFHINWQPFNDVRNWVIGLVAQPNLPPILSNVLAPDKAGLIAVLTGGSVFLAYNAVSIVIKKIPIIGSIWGWLTGIINGLSIVTIVIGALIIVYL